MNKAFKVMENTCGNCEELQKHFDFKINNLENNIAGSLRDVAKELGAVATSNTVLAQSNKSLKESLDATVNVLKNSVPLKIVILLLFAVILGRNSDHIGLFIAKFFGI